MSANPMPTEMQCLASRLCDDAGEIVNDLGLMAIQLAVDKFDAEECEGWAESAGILMEEVRAMQFDAARLAVLVDRQAADARHLYSQTMALVDACRMARSNGCPPDRRGAQTDPTAVALSDLVEEELAAMQALIAAQFPGEKIPGG